MSISHRTSARTDYLNDNIPNIKMKINIAKLIKNRYTYPSWTTSTCYKLNSEEIDNNFLKVYYIINKCVKRKVERIFPKELTITPRFAFVLGLICGEGANKLGKSNYRRFTFTNKDPELIKIVLNELDRNKILNIKNLPDKSFYIHHTKKEEKDVVVFWSKMLGFDKNKFNFIKYKIQSSEYGVCHFYLSDVLLRRVIDLLNESLKRQPNKKNL